MGLAGRGIGAGGPGRLFGRGRLAFLLGLLMMTIRLVLVALEDISQLRRTGTVTEQRHDEEEAV